MVSIPRSGVAVLAACLLVVTAVGAGLAATPAAGQERGWSAEFRATVTADGEIARAGTVVRMDAASYERLREQVRAEGYETVAAALAAQQVAGKPQYGGYRNARDRRVSGGYELSWDYTNIDLEKSDRSELSVDGGTVTLLVGGIEPPSRNPSFSEITYRIEMPGRITDTNADETDGTTAIWRLHENAPSVLSVEANASATGESDEETDATTTAGENGPGFGLTATLVGLLVVTATLGRRVAILESRQS